MVAANAAWSVVGNAQCKGVGKGGGGAEGAEAPLDFNPCYFTAKER